MASACWLNIGFIRHDVGPILQKIGTTSQCWQSVLFLIFLIAKVTPINICTQRCWNNFPHSVCTTGNVITRSNQRQLNRRGESDIWWMEQSIGKVTRDSSDIWWIEKVFIMIDHSGLLSKNLNQVFNVDLNQRQLNTLPNEVPYSVWLEV